MHIGRRTAKTVPDARGIGQEAPSLGKLPDAEGGGKPMLHRKFDDTFHLPLPNSGVTRDFPVLYREILRIYETPLHSLAKFNDSKGMRLPSGNGK